MCLGYYAFGLRKVGSPNSNVNKYLYNDKELQEELGQYDYGARFYDPVIGRWNVVDPMSEHSESLNPYHYCSNNPMNRIDPDGKCDQPDCPHRATIGDTPDAANFGIQIGALFVNGYRALKTLAYSAVAKTDPGMKWEAIEVQDKEGNYSSEMRQVPSEGIGKDMLGHLVNGIEVAAPLSMLGKVTTGVMVAKAQSEGMTTSVANKLIKEATSLEAQAKKISTELNGGKNSVTIKTEKGATHFDLQGASHKGSPTPHVQYSHKNVNTRTGQTFLNKDRGPATPITQEQIRLIRKFLEKQN
ncbi:MAG: polymorphic toxin type 24 domain-containing protein [Pedobacter terrae]